MGGPAIVGVLVGAGADLSAREPASGDTPLHVAAYMGVPLAVEALLKAGADLDATNNKGDTALWMAAKGGVARPGSPALKKSSYYYCLVTAAAASH